MYILGISAFYHESAAALIHDGEIICASAEERFTRIKHDASYPENAVDFCLNSRKLKVTNLDYVVFYEKPFYKFQRNLYTSLKYFPKSLSLFVDSMYNTLTEKLWIKSILIEKLRIDQSKVLFVPHHLSHAAASYYPSSFNEAAFLTLDGVGEWTTGSWGVCKENKIVPQYEMKFPHSVGLFYSALTAYLGFEVNEGEYKVMGMAGYGKPLYLEKMNKLYTQHSDSSLELNLSYFSFQHSSKSMYSKKLKDEFDGLAKVDIAASLQSCTESIILKMVKHVAEKTKMKNLVYSGGVALNSVINSKLTTRSKFKNIFIFPAAGDDGGAVGAALYVYHHILKYKKRILLQNIFLGKEFTNVDIKRFIKKNNISTKRISDSQRFNYLAQKLMEGKVTALFEGRSEFGPRALGHRSILADPRKVKMKDVVNAKIKFREEFRPFAPVILDECSEKYFDRIDSSLTRYMLGTYAAKKNGRIAFPATVHIDGTSRVQTIPKEEQSSLRFILEAFNKLTDVPVLLNTSFNVKGEPIVNSLEDAYTTFLRTELDVLVLGKYIIEK